MDGVFDIAVVGAGIVGLAHALEGQARGHSVALVDRSPAPQGASVRNFGMVWPIGQPAGALTDRALRSRARWRELAPAAGFWLEECGSLHLAHHEDEEAVLREFLERDDIDLGRRWLEPDEVRRLAPAVRAAGALGRLRGALLSPTECCVDPREAVARLRAWAQTRPNVEARFGVAVVRAGASVQGVELADGERLRARRVLVCPGADLETLYPEAHRAEPLTRCKLQMMRTAPQPGGWRLGPMLAAGSTLRHYGAFADCPSLAKVRARFERDHPELERHGIHVMASQNGMGEVVLGDSHEYGEAFSPDLSADVEAAILGYLDGFLELPAPAVAARWSGVYAKRTDGRSELVLAPEPGVRVVSALGGAGMTLSFGLAEECLDALEVEGDELRVE